MTIYGNHASGRPVKLADRWFVYIDDTGPAGDTAAPVMLPQDRQTYVALVLNPQQNQVINAVMAQLLARLEAKTGETELHCTDLLSGKRGYRNMGLDERMELLTALADTFCDLEVALVAQSIDDTYAKHVVAAYQEAFPSGIPFFSLRSKSDVALLVLLTNVRQALRPCLGSGERAEVVIDEGWKKAGFQVAVPDWADLFCDGRLTSARSVDVPGLQLADFAASTLNRQQRLLERAELSRLDKAFLEVAARLSDLWTNLPSTVGRFEQAEGGKFLLHWSNLLDDEST